MQPSRRTVLTAGAGLATAIGVGAFSGGPAAAAELTGRGPGPCTLDPHAAKRQFRGLWIATVVNIDWPSAPGLPIEQQKAELVGYLDRAVAENLNAIVLQVRPTADALFRSSLEPWSKYLTGTQGVDPGYDPLAFAVDQAHARGLELHAWCNPYRITMNLTTDVAALLPTHPAKLHPEWTIAYGGKLYYNPGVPAARDFCIEAIMQAVTGYDIDAIHFDDYFYPYPVAGETFDDQAQYARYGAGMSLADWRRDNINRLVRGLNSRIKRAKPWVRLGVSPFGVWMNQANDPLGSATSAGAQTYADLYADTRRWVLEEWIDYIAPQIYWANSLAVASYGVLVDWWARVAKGTRVHLYIGEALYKVGASTQSPEWNNDPAELSNHLAIDARHPEVVGNIWYNATSFRANPLDAMGIVARTWYSHPTLVPASPRLDSRPPAAPIGVHTKGGPTGTEVVMRSNDRSTARFAIYRIPLAPGPIRAGDCRLADATNLIAVVPNSGNPTTYLDRAAAGAGRVG